MPSLLLLFSYSYDHIPIILPYLITYYSLDAPFLNRKLYKRSMVIVIITQCNPIGQFYFLIHIVCHIILTAY